MKASPNSGVYQALLQHTEKAAEAQAREIFGSLIQEAQYVGDVYSLGYESALVLIHDFYRKRVGGIPSLSFLIATRIDTSQLSDGSEGQTSLDYKAEDSSVLLLRVMDAAPLPNDAEATRVRVETAQRVSGETNAHWDGAQSMDASTANLLSFAGVKCRVIGTFFLDRAAPESDGSLILRFGSDISNYYPNRGLKVYKPNGEALKSIVNYRDPDRTDLASKHSVVVGEVRYASTNRSFQGISDVKVDIMPADLLGQKTALFGMTRTGKSNSTKIILKSVFGLRFEQREEPLRIGQIVFDPNGEYANENEQDKSEASNPSAIKNVWRTNARGKRADVVTYGITEHPNDPDRKKMLLNFFLEENLQIGKEIINAVLAGDSSKFIQNFQQVVFEKPPEGDKGLTTRYKRRVLVYRTLLNKAGFAAPSSVTPDTKDLFGKDLLLAMQVPNQPPEYAVAAKILSSANPSWGQLSTAFGYLNQFITDRTSQYQTFNQTYMNRPNGSGAAWADDDLLKLLEMFRYANGSRQLGKARPQHTHETDSDYAEDIYEHLKQGKLVIVDQSSGDPEINAASAERIMWHIFRMNQSLFRQAKIPPDILVYIEEAHNLLPSGTDMDMKNIWVRTAKEGAKYHIGMVYATQEVSSIQRNILKNTANWFIGHLNNTDETKELCKYYDFADFETSIRRAQDRGFIRVKTLSNLFVVPIQVQKFEV